MRLRHMNIDKLQHLVRGMDTLDLEVAFFQHEIFALELNRQLDAETLSKLSFISVEEGKIVGTTNEVSFSKKAG